MPTKKTEPKGKLKKGEKGKKVNKKKYTKRRIC